MSMRTQLSLMFQDKQLYEEFILPYKEAKELNSVIIRCLSAYYYDSNIRDLIDGVSLENNTEGEIEVKDTQTIIDNIRNSLVFESMCTAELQNTVEGGISDMTEMMNGAKKMAESSGMVKKTTSEYGSGIYQLALEDISSKEVQPASNSSTGFPIEMFAYLCKVVGEGFNNTKLKDYAQSYGVEDKESVEATTFIEEEDDITPSNISESIVDELAESTTNIEEVEVIEEVEETVTEESVEDASNDMMSLLDSLF